MRSWGAATPWRKSISGHGRQSSRWWKATRIP
nr:MAG TPA: hypothetical protein [Bacteriophage sp.]